MTATIITFPDHKIVRDVPTPVITEQRRKGLTNDAEGLAGEMFWTFMMNMKQFGFNGTESKDMERDCQFIFDIMKSIVYREFGLDHPIHKWLDDNLHDLPKDTDGEINSRKLISPEEFDAILKTIEEAMGPLNDTKKAGEDHVPYDDIPSDTEPTK